MISSLLPILLILGSMSDSLPLSFDGIKAGGNFSLFLKDVELPDIKYSPQLGYSLGIFTNNCISKNGASLKVEFLYNEKHFRMDESGGIADVAMKGISLPILFQFMNPKKDVQPFFNFGISADFVIRCTLGSWENGKYLTEPSIDGFFEPISVGIPVGFGFNYLTNKGIFSLELRNTFDFTKTGPSERFNVFYLYLNYGVVYPRPYRKPLLTELI